MIKTDIVACRIVGIKKPKTTPDFPRPQFNGSEDDVQWVEISGCQYSISEGELLCWLNLYGEVLSKIINRLSILNGLIKLDWLNLGLNSFKIKMKQLFMT